jgi:hypothetical protein
MDDLPLHPDRIWGPPASCPISTEEYRQLYLHLYQREQLWFDVPEAEQLWYIWWMEMFTVLILGRWELWSCSLQWYKLLTLFVTCSYTMKQTINVTFCYQSKGTIAGLRCKNWITQNTGHLHGHSKNHNVRPLHHTSPPWTWWIHFLYLLPDIYFNTILPSTPWVSQ